MGAIPLCNRGRKRERKRVRVGCREVGSEGETEREGDEERVTQSGTERDGEKKRVIQWYLALP